MTRKYLSTLTGGLVIAIGLLSVGCAAPTVTETKGSTSAKQRIGPPIGPMLRGPGSLPKTQLRAPGVLPEKGDPCDVPRGSARGEGCSGNPGDTYVPAQFCDSGKDSSCPSSNVTPGHFINNTTDPKATDDQSDPTKLYAENGENGERTANTGEERTTDVAQRETEQPQGSYEEQPSYDVAGSYGDECGDCG